MVLSANDCFWPLVLDTIQIVQVGIGRSGRLEEYLICHVLSFCFDLVRLRSISPKCGQGSGRHGRGIARSQLEPGAGRGLVLLLLGLLGVPAAGLGLAERADGRVAVDLLVAGQARLHRRRLLSAVLRVTCKETHITTNYYSQHRFTEKLLEINSRIKRRRLTLSIYVGLEVRSQIERDSL